MVQETTWQGNRDKYDAVPDEALILRLRDGETEIESYLLEKYKGLVRTRARELYLAGGDREDLLQEGMMGLFRAIREFEPGREASFSTYAAVVITHYMLDAVQRASRRKHQILNNSLSISDLEEQADSRLGISESPENIIVSMENARDLRERIDGALSPLERRVLERYLDGQSYTEIAEAMERSPKSIDNALQRIRAKVSGLLRA